MEDGHTQKRQRLDSSPTWTWTLEPEGPGVVKPKLTPITYVTVADRSAGLLKQSIEMPDRAFNFVVDVKRSWMDWLLSIDALLGALGLTVAGVIAWLLRLFGTKGKKAQRDSARADG